LIVVILLTQIFYPFIVKFN